jgi:hypothetical protein
MVPIFKSAKWGSSWYVSDFTFENISNEPIPPGDTTNIQLPFEGWQWDYFPYAFTVDDEEYVLLFYRNTSNWATSYIALYNPKTGEELWRVTGMENPRKYHNTETGEVWDLRFTITSHGPGLGDGCVRNYARTGNMTYTVLNNTAAGASVSGVADGKFFLSCIYTSAPAGVISDTQDFWFGHWTCTSFTWAYAARPDDVHFYYVYTQKWDAFTGEKLEDEVHPITNVGPCFGQYEELVGHGTKAGWEYAFWTVDLNEGIKINGVDYFSLGSNATYPNSTYFENDSNEIIVSYLASVQNTISGVIGAPSICEVGDYGDGTGWAWTKIGTEGQKGLGYFNINIDDYTAKFYGTVENGFNLILGSAGQYLRTKNIIFPDASPFMIRFENLRVFECAGAPVNLIVFDTPIETVNAKVTEVTRFINWGGSNLLADGMVALKAVLSETAFSEWLDIGDYISKTLLWATWMVKVEGYEMINVFDNGASKPVVINIEDFTIHYVNESVSSAGVLSKIFKYESAIMEFFSYYDVGEDKDLTKLKLIAGTPPENYTDWTFEGQLDPWGAMVIGGFIYSWEKVLRILDGAVFADTPGTVRMFSLTDVWVQLADGLYSLVSSVSQFYFVSSVPADAETGVTPEAPIQMTFNTELDVTSITGQDGDPSGNMVVSYPGVGGMVYVPTSHSADTDVIKTLSLLPCGTVITVSLGGTLKNTDGDFLNPPATFSFTTAGGEGGDQGGDYNLGAQGAIQGVEYGVIDYNRIEPVRN